jgi:serine/threonine-protein kinase
MVYLGPGDDGLGTQLWIRHWDELDARPILTAEDSDIALLRSPSISPDGREVAYFVGGVLKVSPTEGGLTRTLARGLGMPYWGEDGWVYFTGGASEWSLGRIRATGGESEVVTELAENEQTHTWAELLPGGRTLLFTVSGDGLQSGAEHEIWSVDLETGQRMFLTSGMHARYAPTGHLIFGNADGQLLAAPFDVDRVALTGPGVPVADGLDRLARQHAYALSKEGDLVYRTGGSGEARELVWVARDESIRAVADDAVLRWAAGGIGIDGMSLSPDGTRIAYVDFVGGRKDLWSRALPDGAPVRLTFDEASEQSPTWSPDGESIVFARNETIQPNDWTLWTVPASGAGQPELLYHGGADGVWSPDGARLVIRLIGGGDIGPRGLQILRPGIDTVAVPLAANAGSTGPAVSPDGRWLAYASNETGRDEVYVRPFPNVASGKWQVSTEGGVQPVWAHSGRELFFLDPSTAELSAVAVTVDGDAFRPGPVTTLFRSPLRPSGGNFTWGRDYGVAANDQEFLMTRLAPDGGSRIVVVQNFFEELKRLAPN